MSEEFELAVKFDKSALIQRGIGRSILHTMCKPFKCKRLITYSFERLSKANLGAKRLEEAKSYLNICPTCKKNTTVANFTSGKEMVIE